LCSSGFIQEDSGGSAGPAIGLGCGVHLPRVSIWPLRPVKAPIKPMVTDGFPRRSSPKK
jgi:hypothetical protein